MSKNGNLHAAKKAENDEFYTRLADIENELKHYGDFFRGKAVYCNCDHPTESNFPRYFLERFDELGIESITATCYVPGSRGWKGEKRKSGEYTVEQMDGDGDFRSEECIKLLDECDAVVTNPPFSLFREYVAQLMEYGKKFLIIGNQNAITYKEIFPYIKQNEMWLGCTPVKEFLQPDGTAKKFGNIGWFTNIPHAPAGKPLVLEKHYDPEEYPKYDNYDAIEVSKTADIPMDYDGVMGVPITFLDKYNPDQFEIVGCADANIIPEGWRGATKQFIELYYKEGNRLACYVDHNGNAKIPYKRILIRRKGRMEPAEFEIVDAREVALSDKQRMKSTMLIKDADGAIDGKNTYARICIRRKQKMATNDGRP